jgi:hypothetical protein
LGDYTKNITGDVDDMWDRADADGSGVMDKAECKVFIDEVKAAMVPERAANYDEANFETLFNKFDEDKNGFMDKTEMSVFMKKVFKQTAA